MSQTTLPPRKIIRNAVRHAWADSTVWDVEPADYLRLKVNYGTERTRAMFDKWGKCGQCAKDGKSCPRWLLGSSYTPSTSTFREGWHSGYWTSEKVCNGSQLTHSDVKRIHDTSRDDGYDALFWYAHVYDGKPVDQIPADIVKILCKQAPHFKNAAVSYADGRVQGVDYTAEMAKFAKLERLLRSVVPDLDKIQRESKAEEAARAAANKLARAAKAAAGEDDTRLLLARGSAIMQLAREVPKRPLEIEEIDDLRPSKSMRMDVSFLLN